MLAGGKGWGLEEIQAAVADLGLGQQVRLPGYVADAALPLWYNAAAVLVVPSVYEGWGLPVIEALACGTPVVVSDVSSLPEAAGEAGLRLPPDDAPAWTEALRRALEDEQWRAEARMKGLQHAARFRWEGTAQAHVQSYRKALEGKP